MDEEEGNREEGHEEELEEDTVVEFECPLNKKWTGQVSLIKSDRSEIIFKTLDEMAIDEHGLVHSSFLLGACEYAALTVINGENMFIQNIEAEYLAPVEVGTECIIKALVKYQGDKKKIVFVQAFKDQIKIFDGTFSILELEQHILDIKLNEEVE